MSTNRTTIMQHLQQGSLKALFIQELGWDRFDSALETEVEKRIYPIQGIAEKRGMAVYRCETAPGEPIPGYPTRRKIQQKVAQISRENILIFTDGENTTQVWQWAKREPGKPIATREHTWHSSNTGHLLADRLEAIAFSLDEEDALTLPEVAGRAAKAFDVEKVTKKFYERFKKEHDAFHGFIQGITDDTDHKWYASVMLNRLMFVYFVQRKGFLDGDKDYLRNRLNKMRTEKGKDRFYPFYRYFLLRLFHEGLGGAERNTELDQLLGRIPYLNGGLFDVHELERPERYGEDINIPDEAFERLFDFFDEYNWHLDERPLRKDNEINPDVLGYIFEKYINQKQMGAYYTKEDITEYISKNTVIPFLFDAARAKCKVAFENPNGPTIWDFLQDDPDRYIYPAVRHGISWDIHHGTPLEEELPLPPEIEQGVHPPTLHEPVGEGPIKTLELRKHWNKPAPETHALPTETWRELIARRHRYHDIRGKIAKGEVRSINDFITLNLDIRQFAQDVIERCEDPLLLRAFWHAIEKVTVLDPTCGSGAFLFAALNILEPLYEACLERMQAYVEELEGDGKKHRPEKYADFRRVLDTVAVHPSRRYFILKNIILQNLYGVDIMEEAVEICKLRLFLKLAAQVDPDAKHANLGIEPLPDIDFNIKAGNTLVGYVSLEQIRQGAQDDVERLAQFEEEFPRIQNAAADLQTSFDRFREMQVKEDGAVPSGLKEELRKRLNALNQELDRYLAREYGINPEKTADFNKWKASHQPFHWLVEFFGIMQQGGFDVIIGNPPYVEYRKVVDSYALLPYAYTSEEAGNLYAYCMERSCRLLEQQSRFGMIVPTALLGLDETVSLREVLLEHFGANWFSTYAIRPSKLFDGVDQRLCIHLATPASRAESPISATKYRHWNAEERPNLFATLQYNAVAIHPRLLRVPQVGCNTSASVLQKLELNCSRLSISYQSPKKSGYLMHYHRSPRYWIRAMDFEPYFKSSTRSRSVHHFRDIYFSDAQYGKLIGALLNSTLFFFWFVSIGNGRNITGTDVKLVPVGKPDASVLQAAAKAFSELMSHYDTNSFVRYRKDCEYQEFRPSLSKPIIDQLDSVLARHYGFTEEQLDFIVNYDIKYRMGKDGGS